MKNFKGITKDWNWQELNKFGICQGIDWSFTSADAPWQNDVTMSLIKFFKTALTRAFQVVSTREGGGGWAHKVPAAFFSEMVKATAIKLGILNN